jgi:hypothetical protein
VRDGLTHPMKHPLRKAAVVLVLGLAATAAMAEWSRIKGDPTLTLLADPVTIRRSGDMVTMWSLLDYTKPRTNARGQAYLSSKQYREYDCAGRLSRRLEFSRYTENTGWGQVLDANKTPGAWSPVVSGSVAGELLKFACGEK